MNEDTSIVIFVYSEERKDSIIPPNVTHVKMDPSVKEIREDAFRGMASLVEVEFSEGLEVIHSNAFASCTNLRHTNQLPSTLKEIGESAFFGCYCLERLLLPQGLKTIGGFAFCGCRKLKEIKIPSSMISIHDRIFADCTSLTSVELPEGLKTIGEGWFKGCSALVGIEVPSSVIKIHPLAFLDCKNLASLDFKEGLEEIGDRAFKRCESIVNIHLPVTLRRVGREVFEQCNRLRSCVLPEGFTIIGDAMFSECTSLDHVAIPETVTSIGERAFGTCMSLEQVRIPSRVVRIGSCAFECCSLLKSVKIESDSLTKIEKRVFQCCLSLTHLRLPSSTMEIEYGAFSHCARLVSLEFPKGLEGICIDHLQGLILSFDGCTSLVNLVVPASQQVDLDEELDMMTGRNLINDLEALAHVTSNVSMLIPILQHRFDNKPVHELCYYQSYYPVDETRHQLHQRIRENPSTVLDVDAFGMTPFHILALSQTPMLPLFEALLDMHCADITALANDRFGKSPMDYLCMTHTPESTTVIRSLLRKAISKRTQWLGLERWEDEVMTAMDEAIAAEWSLRRQEIELLIVKVAKFEQMEAVSLLELAIWKMKIDEQDSDDVADCYRQECRFSSGADVIIRNTLLFLNEAWPMPSKEGDFSHTRLFYRATSTA